MECVERAQIVGSVLVFHCPFLLAIAMKQQMYTQTGRTTSLKFVSAMATLEDMIVAGVDMTIMEKIAVSLKFFHDAQFTNTLMNLTKS